MSDSGWITLDLDGKRQIQIQRKTLQNIESSRLAKYFLGHEHAKLEVSKWIVRKGENHFYIRRPWTATENLFMGIARRPTLFDAESSKCVLQSQNEKKNRRNTQ